MTFSLVDQYRQIHLNKKYGAASSAKAPYLIPHIRALGARSVIDYGCGQSTFPDMIRASGVETVFRYDPAIPAYAERPTLSFDLLVSVDVLEHVPESEIDAVLSDMRSLADNALLVIDIKPAKEILPNGENAHAIVQPPEWWAERLSRFWDYIEPFPGGSKPRAWLKTWPTPPMQRPLIWGHKTYLRIKKHLPG